MKKKNKLAFFLLGHWYVCSGNQSGMEKHTGTNHRNNKQLFGLCNSLADAFYLQSSKLIKQTKNKKFVYENFSLGNIHQVFCFNSVNPSIFYQNDQKLVILDPFLNQNKTIDLPIGTTLVSALENRLFLDLQQRQTLIGSISYQQ